MNTVDRAASCLVRYLKAAEVSVLRTWLTGIKEIQKFVVSSSHLSFTQNSCLEVHTTNHKKKIKLKVIPYPPTLCITKCGEALALYIAVAVHL